jgi:hypothetical protein
VDGARRGIDCFARACDGLLRDPAGPTELFGGAAGLACAAADLADRAPMLEAESLRTLESRRAALLGRVHERLAEPIASRDGGRAALGLAHGVAGELWALVRGGRARSPHVDARLGELAGLGKAEGDAALTPAHVGGRMISDLSSTLCNGVPGQALLWLDVASEQARPICVATFVLRSGLGSICCGLAGHAIVLERYGGLAGDPQFQRRARDRLRQAVALCSAAEALDPGLSLWHGAPGIALVAAMRRAGESYLPTLEPPRRRQVIGRARAAMR